MIAKLVEYENPKSVILQEWSEEEIKDYREIRKRKLDAVYTVKEIPLKDPASRARYLIGVLERLGYDFEKNIANIVEREKGKSKALTVLENAVLMEFGGYEEWELK